MNPRAQLIVTPEQITREQNADWVAFLLELPVSFWNDDKTPEQRGSEAFRLWKESGG
jgi:hypothetical protein